MARARIGLVRSTREVVITGRCIAPIHLLSRLLLMKVFEEIALLPLIIRDVEGVTC